MIIWMKTRRKQQQAGDSIIMKRSREKHEDKGRKGKRDCETSQISNPWKRPLQPRSVMEESPMMFISLPTSQHPSWMDGLISEREKRSETWGEGERERGSTAVEYSILILYKTCYYHFYEPAYTVLCAAYDYINSSFYNVIPLPPKKKQWRQEQRLLCGSSSSREKGSSSED